MRQFGFIAFLLLTALLATAQTPPRVQKPTDIGNDASSVPRPGYLRPNWDGINLKYRDANNVLRSLADLVGPISTTATSSTFTQNVADNRYRLKTDGITYSELTAGKPTDLSAFANSPGYQTSSQVTTAITNALVGRLTQSQADGLYRKVGDNQLASTISNFAAAARAAITVTGTGASYNQATGELAFTGGAGGSSFTQAQIRAMFSFGAGLQYDPTTGVFSINVANLNAYIDNRLKSYDGYATGKVLQADGSGAFAWVTPTSSTTTGSSTTTVGSTANTSAADSTVGRINLATMTSLTITTAQQFQDLLNGPITNKNVVIGAVLDATNCNEQFGFTPKGNWSNVRMSMLNSSCGLTNTYWTQVFAFVNPITVSQVQLDGLKMSSACTYAGSEDPTFRTNELVTFNGFEMKGCEIFSTSGSSHNLIGFTQYSVSSHTGAISQNLFFHDNYFHDAPRMAVEITSQGYDGITRFKNITYVRNRHNNLGKNNIYGMGCSFSGDIDGIYFANNTSLEPKNVAYEFVNTRNVYALNNSATATVNETCGYGISDDAHRLTDNLHIVGGNFTVTSRPFYIYDTQNVTIDGGTYTGNSGVDMKVNNSVFRNVSITHRNKVANQASWTVDGTSHGNLFDGLFITNAGSNVSPYAGSFNPFQLNSGTFNNTVRNMNTTIGKQLNGTYYNNGAVVNNGTATPANTIVTATNSFQQAPN